MKLFLLSPEIYVDATRSPGGPPAQLFSAYVGMRDTVGFVITPWLQTQIQAQLTEAGYDEATAKDQAEFIASLGHGAADPDVLGEDPLVAIAKSHGLDAVYHASGRENATVEGVTFKPVHELMSVLTA